MELLKIHQENKHRKFAKPFLKWAGGKSQLLGQLAEKYPNELKLGIIENYYEPFLGGGAVFFDIAQKYNIKNSYLYDNNEELILVYIVIQAKVDDLIDFLNDYKQKFLGLDEKKRGDFFYNVRSAYNSHRFNINYNKYSENWIPRAAQMIFLNKTCFNGLFRLNRSGEFNVPFGRYKNPSILDEGNLRSVSALIQNANIIHTDFEILKSFVDDKSFIYFDPPYRPISKTANFNSFTKTEFDDAAQIRLSETFKVLDKLGAKLMLSNSNPQNNNPNDDFFEQLYKGFNIYKVKAKRMINCIGKKRGHIEELLITNYD
jgi:DNA adenine methylase